MLVRALAILAVLLVMGFGFFVMNTPADGELGVGAASRPPGQPPEYPTTFPSDLPGPSPEMLPAEVVRTILAALRENHTPVVNAGVATAFSFASPNNRRATGPLPRFAAMVLGPPYAPLVFHRRSEVGQASRFGPYVEFPVTVEDGEGRITYFRFTLSQQQHGEFEGCWMTEAVARLPEIPPPPQPEPKGMQKM